MSANNAQAGREPGLFNRYFIFLWLINLASMLAHSSLNSVIAPFIEYLGFSSSYNGYIGIVFAQLLNSLSVLDAMRLQHRDAVRNRTLLNR